MSRKAEITKRLKELKPLLSDRYSVKKIGFFGSYAQGKETAQSDLDLLVQFDGPVGWEFFALERFLEQELGLKVDLVTEEALKEGMKDNILEEVIYL
jgi:hypothetical protein